MCCCNKVRIGLRTRKSGVASKRVFIGPESVHKTKTKLKLALCLSSKDSLWVCSRSGSLSPRSAGRFSLISPQSLELDTGVNHHSLDLLFLPLVSAPDLPLHPSHSLVPLATYPHRPTQAGEPSGLQPPPPPFLERKSATAICAPACGPP